jgi:hypothetical protein
MQMLEFTAGRKRRLPCWEPLLSTSSISPGMAKRAAESGLVPEHLFLAYRRADQVQLVLSERTVNKKPRVSNKKNVIEKITAFISANV